jgi:hypothetical protein
MAKRVTPPSRPSTRRPRWLVRLNEALDLNRWLGGRLPVRALPRALWVAGLLVVYIYFSHSAERLLRRTDRARRELDEFLTEYTTEKAAFMKEGRQSEIARKVQAQGLVDYKNQQPPTKLTLRDSSSLHP